MNISGIRPGSGFYEYSAVRNSELRSQQIQQAKSAELAANSQNTTDNSQLNIESAPKQTFSSLDYASQYQPEATYELKGSESSLMDLDMEKAISDMQKDQLIQQYQFFVGEAQVTQSLGQGAAPARAMENFDF